jgi:histone H3/H4
MSSITDEQIRKMVEKVNPNVQFQPHAYNYMRELIQAFTVELTKEAQKIAGRRKEIKEEDLIRGVVKLKLENLIK